MSYVHLNEFGEAINIKSTGYDVLLQEICTVVLEAVSTNIGKAVITGMIWEKYQELQDHLLA